MWYFCNIYGSSADDGHSVKNMLDSIFFTRLFVSERKQIAMMRNRLREFLIASLRPVVQK